jgi:hypothetical protein
MCVRFVRVAVAMALAAMAGAPAWGQEAATFQIEFNNAKQYPAHWVLTINPDGSGQFDSDGGQPPADAAMQIVVGEVHRAIQMSPQFAAQVFATAKRRRWFAMECDSHMKVAFQGTKTLSYKGPDGSGSCAYNYSKDKEIQALGDELIAVQTTVLFGAKLDKLLVHDRLGVDQEMESLMTAVQEGNAIEMGTIRETLNKIADDEQVLERARRKARKLLAQADAASGAAAQAAK